jgi:hypothetical protein
MRIIAISLLFNLPTDTYTYKFYVDAECNSSRIETLITKHFNEQVTFISDVPAKAFDLSNIRHICENIDKLRVDCEYGGPLGKCMYIRAHHAEVVE